MVAALPHWITRCPLIPLKPACIYWNGQKHLRMASKTTIALKGLFGLRKAQENQKISVKAKLLSYRAVYCFRKSIKYSLVDFFRQGRPPTSWRIFFFAKMCTGSWVVNFNHTFIFWGPFCWNLSWANGVRCINISPIQNPAQICRHIGGLHPQLYCYPWKRCGPRWFTRGCSISINT